MVKIRFSPSFPSALRAEVEDVLEPLLTLIDLHLDEVRVALKGAGTPEGEAVVVVKRQYHSASIWLDPSFFEIEEDEREATLIHELMHVLVDILSREAERVVAEFVPEGIHDFVYGILRDAEETLTNALVISFERLHGRLTRAEEVAMMEGEIIRNAFDEGIHS